MTPRAYYNEHEPFTAEWLRQLIAAGAIMDGEVDERDIQDVRPADLLGFARCHFFAGISGWDYALALAGWPDDVPVWTGSCPCQPFSAAGARKGTADERHLWPEWHRLIRECRPPVVFGEQVAAAIGHGWLDAIFDDLEAEGYACGAVVLPACSVGAPHIRQRLWFVADAEHAQRRPVGEHQGYGRDGTHGGWAEAHGKSRARGEVRCVADSVGDGRWGVAAPRLHAERTLRNDTHRCGKTGLVANMSGTRLDRRATQRNQRDKEVIRRFTEDGATGCVADRLGSGLEGYAGHGDDGNEPRRIRADQTRPVAASYWADCIWLPCRDGKARPTQPGLQPLAYGVPARVGRLRAYGNAIVPQVAAEVIRAYMDTRAVWGRK